MRDAMWQGRRGGVRVARAAAGTCSRGLEPTVAEPASTGAPQQQALLPHRRRPALGFRAWGGARGKGSERRSQSRPWGREVEPGLLAAPCPEVRPWGRGEEESASGRGGVGGARGSRESRRGRIEGVARSSRYACAHPRHPRERR
jgi:hypothetical protein